jgi:SAM-dependent methyltransferase
MGIRTVGCLSCGLVFTNPQPSADSISRFYAHDYRRLYQSIDVPTREYIAALGKDVRAESVAEHILAMLANTNVEYLADLGCAEGSLLRALRVRFTRARLFGVEVNKAFADFARALTDGNIVASTMDLPRKHFDLVVINHVLEHIVDPVAYLREAVALLRPTGRLYVAVPDASAYHSIRDLHIAHLFHFTTRSLTRCIQRAGLHVLSCEITNPPRHPTTLAALAELGDSQEIEEMIFDPTGWPEVRTANRYAVLYHLRHAIALQRARLKAVFTR